MGALVGTTAAVTALATAGAATATPPASSSAAAAPAAEGPAHSKSDSLPHPKADAQAKLRKAAVDQVVKGKANVKTINGKRVIEMQAPDDASNARGKTPKGKKKGKYVEYEPNQNAALFTILVDFGDKTMSPQGGTAGPRANQIAAPDRANDNSTFWKPNFDRAHYLDMMFGPGESMKSFYKAQSLGRYNLTGDVSDWVTVPYNEARYGHNPVPGDGTSEAGGYWNLVNDSVKAWFGDQKKAGKTDQQIKDYLAQFDKWDRYDYDGDGDFNEPDGYVDHIQVIHAGEGEEAGGGAQGEDAIWSHRWAVQSGMGTQGPTGNKNGGVPIGNSGIWVFDYTMEPENGGLGVFAHEYGHDLGLPDFYDTAGGDNSTAFWTLMSGGSWLNHGKTDIGTTPGYMGAWEKIYLGWADVKSVTYKAGTKLAVATGPADVDDKKLPQVVAVNLPDKTVTTDYNKPKSGSYEWWSGRGNDMKSSLTRDIDLTGASSASVSTAVAHDIEEDYDFLYGQVSTDGGANWTDVGQPVTGKNMAWGTASYDLSAYKGQKIKFRFLYVTDGALNEAGAFLDDLTVTIDGVSTVDNVESATSAWVGAGGFERITGSVSKQVSHYYLAEYRRYAGYDKTLRTGPYNFGWANTRPDWVERFPYQDGLLVWYINNEYTDNNTSQHPGAGMALPVDANPANIKFADGTNLGNRRQPYDATFGTERTDAFTLHRNGVPLNLPSRPAVRTFNDSDPNRYYDPANKLASVKVAGSGTSITVKSQSPNGMKLDISFAK
ncbi:immune inhibitor A [Yimella sp. cx-51]|nr:immune inhibitor A [Yimella sp. cx-51]QTH39546.1 immune inhibitor A [Yimella sp. cx-51]